MLQHAQRTIMNLYLEYEGSGENATIVYYDSLANEYYPVDENGNLVYQIILTFCS